MPCRFCLFLCSVRIAAVSATHIPKTLSQLLVTVKWNEQIKSRMWNRVQCEGGPDGRNAVGRWSVSRQTKEVDTGDGWLWGNERGFKKRNSLPIFYWNFQRQFSIAVRFVNLILGTRSFLRLSTNHAVALQYSECIVVAFSYSVKEVARSFGSLTASFSLVTLARRKNKV